ncbi:MULTISPECIES: hypothetical protein [unclassified Frankia]|uniref:hypothetical protein n=1 Tax=unclassified Frankia TaxID=2632575 RepID=UPI002AD1F8F5|nr:MULTISPECIES: hypothetical protein [unclassified Frankia]
MAVPRELPGNTRGRLVDVLVRLGVGVFAIGLLATVIIIVPFFFGVTEQPTWLNVLAAGGLTIGFGIALIAIVAAVLSPAPVDDTGPDDTEPDDDTGPDNAGPDNDTGPDDTGPDDTEPARRTELTDPTPSGTS